VFVKSSMLNEQKSSLAAAGERKVLAQCWLNNAAAINQIAPCLTAAEAADGPRVMLQIMFISGADLHFSATVSTNLNAIYSFDRARRAKSELMSFQSNQSKLLNRAKRPR